jgi:uracil-DNA glycosylase family 4
MPPMDADTIRQYLEFYQDLHIETLYRRTSVADAASPAVKASVVAAPPAPVIAASESKIAAAESKIAAAEPKMELPPLAPPDDSLIKIMQDIGDCHRCRLSEARDKIVFGVGDEKAPLVFVGEGPGADEDAQGIPFVGRAGQLLTQMIEGTSKKEGIPLLRKDVYICNVVKCRPPGNRTPESDEMETCGQFLYRQLSAIRPKAICALGGTAARAVTGHKEGVTKMRGKWFKWNDIPVMVTYHPSYLLRPYNENAKREAWEDLKKVLHFVYD